ncbi:hypothetical protein ACJIZ3_024004 [Penstemon smallii]|uniref:Uncharacterized protein n=1 Tax=Penstemon smallii TaxID=265156 RepID=A0ABD3TT36_9LAMI
MNFFYKLSKSLNSLRLKTPTTFDCKLITDFFQKSQKKKFNHEFVENITLNIFIFVGGACGLDNDVANAPYYGLIAAGNQKIFKHGNGCGTYPSCSGRPITVTITDECPGACNNQPFHFDLNGKAFGYLAKRGHDYALRKMRIIDVEYKRVPCHYKANIAFKIDIGSNPYYVAFAVENVNIDGDLASISIKPWNGNWLAMKQSWGATWMVGIPIGIKGPFIVTITTIESRRLITAYNVIPANWAPGKQYYSKVNF